MSVLSSAVLFAMLEGASAATWSLCLKHRTAGTLHMGARARDRAHRRGHRGAPGPGRV